MYSWGVTILDVKRQGLAQGAKGYVISITLRIVLQDAIALYNARTLENARAEPNTRIKATSI
jgi:hypothetical protein